MFVTGPKVVKTVTGEEISTEELGGANVHSTKSGVSHFLVNDEEEGMMLIRKLISYLPSNNLEEPPVRAPFHLDVMCWPVRERPSDQAFRGLRVSRSLSLLQPLQKKRSS